MTASTELAGTDVAAPSFGIRTLSRLTLRAAAHCRVLAVLLISFGIAVLTESPVRGQLVIAPKGAVPRNRAEGHVVPIRSSISRNPQPVRRAPRPAVAPRPSAAPRATASELRHVSVQEERTAAELPLEADAPPGDETPVLPAPESVAAPERGGLFDPADGPPAFRPAEECVADACCDACDCCGTGLHCTPQMVGDFFGFVGSSIRFDNQQTNRLGVFTNNLPSQSFPSSNNPLTVTANNVNGNITLDPNINGGSFGTGVQVFPIATGGFTSTLSVNALNVLLQGNNNAIVPIVDAAAYNSVAATAAGQRFGPGGLLIFVPNESGALANGLVADEVLRSGFDVLYVYDYTLQMQVASPSTSGVAVGRQKIAENGSPLCRDRVFVDYGYLGDGNFFPGGLDVHRVVPGFEKCFCDGLFSVEMRFPFASTLDSDIHASGFTDTNNIEFGNITTYFKVLLAGGGRNDKYAVSAGLGVALPTGDDVRVFDAVGTELVAVDNESVHLLPFVGGVYTPNPRVFMQGFAQLDLDTNGNPVSVHDYARGQLIDAGRAQDVNYLYLDAGFGWWALQNRKRCGLVQGIAPMFELHYNLPLNDTDVVTAANGFQVGNWMDRAEALNGVAALNFALRNNASLTAAYVAPLGGFDDQYDGAFRLTFNWLYGP